LKRFGLSLIHLQSKK